MARVQEVTTASDGLVRAVVLRIKDGVYKRPVQKIVVLFKEEEEGGTK